MILAGVEPLKAKFVENGKKTEQVSTFKMFRL
jgi:hypothetical protein